MPGLVLSCVGPQVESGKAAKLVAKVLQQCRKELGSDDAVKNLWMQSRLSWSALGMPDEDLEEFLEDQVSSAFSQSSTTVDPPTNTESMRPLLAQISEIYGETYFQIMHTKSILVCII